MSGWRYAAFHDRCCGIVGVELLRACYFLLVLLDSVNCGSELIRISAAYTYEPGLCQFQCWSVNVLLSKNCAQVSLGLQGVVIVGHSAQKQCIAASNRDPLSQEASPALLLVKHCVTGCQYQYWQTQAACSFQQHPSIQVEQKKHRRPVKNSAHSKELICSSTKHRATHSAWHDDTPECSQQQHHHHHQRQKQRALCKQLSDTHTHTQQQLRLR
jgi:hypothetical protein